MPENAHGTRSSYVGGCRCTACREANAAYITEWRHRTGQTDPTLDCRLHPSPHGSIGRYQKGCRCDECREANRAMVERWKRGKGVQPVPNRARMRDTRWPEYYGGGSNGTS